MNKKQLYRGIELDKQITRLAIRVAAFKDCTKIKIVTTHKNKEMELLSVDAPETMERMLKPQIDHEEAELDKLRKEFLEI